MHKEENIHDTRFRITGLEHNVEYEIKLYAVYRHGDSEPDVRTFTTKPQKPNVGKYFEYTQLQFQGRGGEGKVLYERDGDRCRLA